jgi:hypothetical protein
MTREEYESRKQRRISRMRMLAKKAMERSDLYENSRKSISDFIPLGQPILIGHHSERRHRRDIERMHRYTEKSIEEYEKAKHYENRAVSAESNNSISSDDPDACDKLQAKIEGAEKLQNIMRSANKIYRKGNTPENIASLVALGLSETQAKAGFTPDFCGRIGFADYQLSNNNANISRMKKRLESLSRKPTESKETEMENGIKIVENSYENRVQIFFPGIPLINIRTFLKSHGFHWSKFNGCWQRMQSRYASDLAHQAAKMSA